MSRYDYIWTRFQRWCCSRLDKRPHRTHGKSKACLCAKYASVYTVCDYLLHLKQLRLQYATILSHKTAICTTVHMISGRDLSQNHVLQTLLKGFKRDIPRKTNPTPDWDLHVVLDALCKAPFEPLSLVDIRYATMKTLFLTSLALAARVSEVQALSLKASNFMVASDKSMIKLTLDAKFVPKNDSEQDPCRSYVVPALLSTTEVQVSSKDRLLCPVRALICYRDRVRKEHLLGTDQRLFRSFLGKKRGLPMKPHSISYYLKLTIKQAYDLLEEGSLIPSMKVTAHEIRGVSATIAALKHVPVKQILEKGYWKSQSTFIRHYFKDLSKYLRKIRGTKVVALANSLAL